MDSEMYEALRDYVKDLYAPEDEVLKSIASKMDEIGIPHIEIHSDEGMMLQFLLTLIGARTVVEIGTLAGYSGIWMARALPEDGRLYTFELNETHARVARDSFARAGLSDRVEVIVGRAVEKLPALSEKGPFDAIFIDADKGGYVTYMDWAVENIRSGGLIMGHNAFSGGDVLDAKDTPGNRAGTIAAFNQRIADDPQLYGTIVPVGDGIAAAIKR